MMIHEITAKVGKKPSRKRIGRGEASGQGGTAGRGHKGAKSRSGFSRRPAFEGGQMPLTRRLPKRGFSNINYRTEFHIVNLRDLEAKVENGATIDATSLAKLGLIRNDHQPLKVLGDGELTKKLKITAAKFSKSAREKIEKAGGSVTEVTPTRWSRATAPVGAKRQRRLEAEKAGGSSEQPKKSDSAQ